MIGRVSPYYIVIFVVAEVSKLPGGPKTIRAGGQLAVHLTDAAHYGVTLLLASGSKAHIAGLREVATKRNMTLEERGLFRGGKIVAAASEDEIYKALGMQSVPPELREGRDEIARALSGTVARLVTGADIQGILHAHTDRSDGVDTLETMAEATLARGYEYFGVADHSKSAHYAGGHAAAIADIMRLLRVQTVEAGELIVRRGDHAHSMYFVARGEVGIDLNGKHIRFGVGHFSARSRCCGGRDALPA